MAWTNTPARYGVVAIVLHWGSAALLLVLFAMGFYMVSLPDAGYDQEKITLILVHKAIGMGALALLAVPAVQDKLRTVGMEASLLTGADFVKFVETEQERWGAHVKTAGVQAE